jgi:hypothetical protein
MRVRSEVRSSGGVEREWLLAVAVEYGTGSETGVRGGGDEGRRGRQLCE